MVALPHHYFKRYQLPNYCFRPQLELEPLASNTSGNESRCIASELSGTSLPFKVNQDLEPDNLNVFFNAVKSGNLDKVEFLLKNRRINLEKTVNYKKDKEVYEQVTALGVASIENNLPMAKLLINYGADLEGGSYTPEQLAFMVEAKEVLSFLIDIMIKRNLNSKLLYY